MLREFAINIYLFLFRIIFSFFKLFPQEEKTVFVSSFGDNIYHVANEVNQLTDHKLVVLKDSRCRKDFSTINNIQTLQFHVFQVIDYIRSIYHLATSKVIFIDNYFGFLSVTSFKPNVSCVQLWHAAGAIKQFGLMDPSNATRSDRANRRFQKVYDRFSYVVVGSEKMATIFRKSFNLSEDQILRTGIPRTDSFFNRYHLKQIEENSKNEFPSLQGRKIILYAPTFRYDELHQVNLQLDIEKLYHTLGDNYVLLLRLHPAIQGKFENSYPNFVIDVSNYENINHLLVITDILITDYSSIPFEFSLLEKPMIFFTYDLESYTVKQGFWEDYERNLPGPIAHTTDEIVSLIETNKFNFNLIRNYAKQWNQYSSGKASTNIVHFIYNESEANVAEAF
ncbi:Putative CDP-glycerol:glycerophosphate glycerophosphotransferase [Paraliobacillus sp. PM-2]|uniref:CDP-glycerol glycerophosphotransferase family protein n=1 Tax=Paraliobacillus sp. PM-2 TaxID=1462524 RepID=UPI00061C0582|nr:CDP-glycerol glycerophosphotransferase family protein [Paraliobacillus sp. PM-2]CQR46195.1 Putative CDP-glycerol:glycerophosphate glycerophosphotransferase [Paraliobacillus sp. PM-2]